MKHLVIALMTLAFPLALIFEISEIFAGNKDGSIFASVFYLVAWLALMGILLWLMLRPDSARQEEKAILGGKRMQSMRYAIDALRNRTGKPHLHQ